MVPVYQSPRSLMMLLVGKAVACSDLMYMHRLSPTINIGQPYGRRDLLHAASRMLLHCVVHLFFPWVACQPRMIWEASMLFSSNILAICCSAPPMGDCQTSIKSQPKWSCKFGGTTDSAVSMNGLSSGLLGNAPALTFLIVLAPGQVALAQEPYLLFFEFATLRHPNLRGCSISGFCRNRLHSNCYRFYQRWILPVWIFRRLVTFRWSL